MLHHLCLRLRLPVHFNWLLLWNKQWIQFHSSLDRITVLLALSGKLNVFHPVYVFGIFLNYSAAQLLVCRFSNPLNWSACLFARQYYATELLAFSPINWDLILSYVHYCSDKNCFEYSKTSLSSYGFFWIFFQSSRDIIGIF